MNARNVRKVEFGDALDLMRIEYCLENGLDYNTLGPLTEGVRFEEAFPKEIARLREFEVDHNGVYVNTPGELTVER